MRKSEFSEFQIVRTLREVEGGRPARLVCRELGISEQTLRNWRGKYGGMEAADIRRLPCRRLEPFGAPLPAGARQG